MLYFAFNMRGMTGVTDSSEVQDCSLSEEVNMSSTFAFTIHATNRLYNLIQPKITYVTIYDDFGDIDDTNNHGKVIFRGRVSTTKEDSSSAKKTVTCNDALTFLNDSFYTGPDGVKGQNIQAYLNYPLKEFHNNVLENDPMRTIYDFNVSFANVTSSSNAGNLNSNIELTGKTTFEALRELVSAVNWEFRLSYRDSAPHYTVNIARYFGFMSRTPIATGLNLKNLTKDRDYGEFYTRIYPVGGYCFDEKRLQLWSSGQYADNGAQYVNPNNEWYDYVDNTFRKQYVDNVKLVQKYGVYPKRVVYDKIVANSAAALPAARHNLYATAYEDAKKLNDRKETIQVNGYDLYRAGYPMDELKVHNYYQCIDTITGTVVKARLKKKTTYFDKPYEPSLTLEYDGIDTESDVK